MHIDDEVNARIAKASAAFGRLRGSVEDRSGIRLDTKLKVYKAVVLTTLLYACETWIVYQRHAQRLNHFHFAALTLNKYNWHDMKYSIKPVQYIHKKQQKTSWNICQQIIITLQIPKSNCYVNVLNCRTPKFLTNWHMQTVSGFLRIFIPHIK